MTDEGGFGVVFFEYVLLAVSVATAVMVRLRARRSHPPLSSPWPAVLVAQMGVIVVVSMVVGARVAALAAALMAATVVWYQATATSG